MEKNDIKMKEYKMKDAGSDPELHKKSPAPL
jgi:hypothetical protein